MTITDSTILEELEKIKKSGLSDQERMRAQAILLSNDGKKSPD